MIRRLVVCINGRIRDGDVFHIFCMIVVKPDAEIYYCCSTAYSMSQNVATLLIGIILANVNRNSKFFHVGLSNKFAAGSFVIFYKLFSEYYSDVYIQHSLS